MPSITMPAIPYNQVSFFRKWIWDSIQGMNRDTARDNSTMIYCRTAWLKEIREMTHSPVPMSMHILFSSSRLAFSYMTGTMATAARRNTCTNT